MRLFFTVISLLMAGFACAQGPIKLDIPLIKESGKVDTLMDLVFSKSKPGYNKFLIVCTAKHKYEIYQLDDSGAGVIMLMGFKDMKSKGYFEYMGRVVFVEADEFLTELFSKTDQRKGFNLIEGRDPHQYYGTKFYLGYFDYYQRFIDKNIYPFKDKPIKID